MWFAGTFVRLAQLMFFSDIRVEEFSDRQQTGSVKIHLPRGSVYDRNMNELAVSIKMDSVYLNPRKITNQEEVSKTLSRMLEPKNRIKRRALHNKLARSLKKYSGKSFVWARRKVPQEICDKIREKNIRGVGFVKESKRFYPKREIAAKIIGFCGIDNQGLYGLEYKYDKIMRPQSSQFTVLKDALGRPISMPDALSIFEESAPFDIVLTIDERIQYIAEKALERQVKKVGAKSGVAIVMDPATGDILAMAEQPRYNPNNFAKYGSEWWKPKAVADAVEPGSTFKLFVVAAALETKAVRPTERIDCENGRYRVAGRNFREAHYGKYEILTVSEIISKSSNIGAIKLGERLGAERLLASLRLFGFGSKTGIDLPGESAGLLRPVSEWSRWSLPSISFGQEVAVTPIQLISGVSAIANGGYLIRPKLVKALLRNGKEMKVIKTEIRHRVISERTAKAVIDMMVGVVRDGTGKRASIPGFTVAGKTGTAQKIDPVTKTYSGDKYLSSFVGFFPANKPRLAILVMVDEPEGMAWGGVVAAPVFSEIAVRSARILRIPSADMDVYEIDWKKMMIRQKPSKRQKNKIKTKPTVVDNLVYKKEEEVLNGA